MSNSKKLKAFVIFIYLVYVSIILALELIQKQQADTLMAVSSGFGKKEIFDVKARNISIVNPDLDMERMKRLVKEGNKIQSLIFHNPGWDMF